MKLHRIVAFAAAVLAYGTAIAEAPSGYYDSCKGKSGKELLSALHQAMGSHTNVGYDGLWNVYKTSDVRPDGHVWDMYSTKDWGTPSQAKHCGNYSNVGDCINREHSFPKSWFSNGSPMASDAFHIYPTDGKVNGMRSNFPYGECANGTTWSNGNVKGLGKLGSSTFAGYSGQVFEPDDQYKGDFARSYFYMAAAYFDKIAGWSSPMLGGNNYPAFSTWTVNLLLKWHRQDPVSDKETARNDAVYAFQKNRNPFIDHPELVEHIWGDRKTEGWDGQGGGASGLIVLPVDGSVTDLGVTGTGKFSTVVKVMGKDLTQAVSVSASSGWSLSASTISATQANAGHDLTVSANLTKAGTYTLAVTLTSGSAKSTATYKVRVQEGLPATAATEVTSTSFRANWVYVGDATDGKYTLDVKQGTASIDGYPRLVDAAAAHYTVDGLDESTTYTYTLQSASMTSNTVSVTTGAPMPYVAFLYDGELSFACEPGVPSAAEELLVELENISSAVNVSVSAPFQISSNRTDWNTSLTMQPAEDRIYMRLAADRAGTFETEITARTGDYVFESGIVRGYCADPAAEFMETFEANFAKTYTDGEYVGSACRWMFNNVGVVNQSAGDRVYAGEKSCRFGKDSDSSIEMLENKAGGAGTVSFYACRWVNNQSNADPAASIAVEYSTDEGVTWHNVADVAVNNTEYTRYTATVNVAGNVRVRLAQTSGQRIHLDDVAISNYGQSGIHDAEADAYYAWDAFSPAAGTLCIESRRGDVQADVHGIDGITYMAGAALQAGLNSFAVPAGLYIVVVDGQSRRVLVK